MSFSYLFDPNKQFQDRNGVNNVGGFLRVYIDGTDDRATTYKDFNGTLNEADIMLDTDGRAVVIVDDSFTFRIEVYERGGALQWTVTQFTARGEGGGGGSSTPVIVDGTANEIDVTESMTAGVKYYTIGLATVVKNTLLGLLASFSNLVGILNSKADKVQVATAGNLAALDASGNITDSGSKVADFKTKQTLVTDPSASGAGLEFIDSVTQNANGEITPHKKSVQDGTTAQKGVVQLQDSIGSTESATDKAVTPHAVREAINSAVSSAYHAAGTKTVAQLTSSLLVAGNEGCVYNVTDSGTTTSDFVDGAGHPINAGDNVGVCDVGGGVYKFDLLSGFVDLGNYLTKTGDASNTTSTFTKASGDTSTMTSGGKLSAIFTAISSFFASVVSALGGKADKVVSATDGNFASLDSNGNLADSGKKTADFDKKRYSWDTHGMYKVFENPNTNVSNNWVKIAEVDASSVTGSNKAIQFTGYVYNYGQNKRSYTRTKFVKVPFSAVFDIDDDSQGVVVGNISGIEPLFGGPRVDNLIRIEKIGSKHWILELYTYSYQAYSLEIEASSLYYSTLQHIVWASSDLTDTAPGTGTIINSTLDDYDNCVNSIKASDYASGGGIDTALQGKLGTSGDGSNVSVTPDGTSTGYDLGSSTTLKAFAQKFKNLVGALKALAFKDKASYNDLSSGVQSSLDKADSALQSHQSVTDNNPTLSWGTTSKVGKVGSTDLRVTMPANPASNKADKANITGATKCKITYNGQGIVTSGADLDASDIPNLSASKITSGTFDESRIPSSLPNTSIGGSAGSVSHGNSANGTTYKITGVESNSTGAAQPKKLETLKFYKDAGNGTIVIVGNDIGSAGTADRGILRIAAGNGHYSGLRLSDSIPNDNDTVIATPNFAGARVIPVLPSGGAGSTTTPVYIDPDGQVKPCTQGATLKSNTATLYIAGYTDNNIPYYHVKDIKNGCVNHVAFSGITNSTCDITFEAPTLSTGEEYDYVISLEGYNDNTGISTGADVENCKQVLYYDSVNNLWRGEPLFLQATDWRQICVVRGNTCEWKRVALS